MPLNLRQIGIANQQSVTDSSHYPLFMDWAVAVKNDPQNPPLQWADFLTPFMSEGRAARLQVPGVPIRHQ